MQRCDFNGNRGKFCSNASMVDDARLDVLFAGGWLMVFLLQ